MMVRWFVLVAVLAACGKPGDRAMKNEICTGYRDSLAKELAGMRPIVEGAITHTDGLIVELHKQQASAKPIAGRVGALETEIAAARFKLLDAEQAIRKQLLPLYDAAAAAWQGTGDASTAMKAVNDRETELATAPNKAFVATLEPMKHELEHLRDEAKNAHDDKPADQGLADMYQAAQGVYEEVAKVVSEPPPSPTLAGDQLFGEYQKSCR